MVFKILIQGFGFSVYFKFSESYLFPYQVDRNYVV